MRQRILALYTTGAIVYSRKESVLLAVICPRTVATSVTNPDGWGDLQMPANSHREAASGLLKREDDPAPSAEEGRGTAAVRTIRLIDSRAWRASQGASLQFARWLAALATVLVNWIQSGPPQSAVAYLPVLT